MITRIVQLEFEENRIAQFLDFFNTKMHVVNTFPGCLGMKLYQDLRQDCIVITYSHWENEEALERYRKSEAFGQIWPIIKPWFKSKPKAWSLKAYFDGFESNVPIEE